MQDENECLGVANTTSNTYRKFKKTNSTIILKHYWIIWYTYIKLLFLSNFKTIHNIKRRLSELNSISKLV